MFRYKLVLVTMIMTVGLVLVGAACSKVKNNTQQSSASPTVASTANEEYFSQDAKVMLFYSEYCSWCKKQKEVLQELAPQGYRVKPMDVGKNSDLWQQYNIEGTPTFIAPNGTRVVGYQTKEKLKEFLDKYK